MQLKPRMHQSSQHTDRPRSRGIYTMKVMNENRIKIKLNQQQSKIVGSVQSSNDRLLSQQTNKQSLFVVGVVIAVGGSVLSLACVVR